MVPVVHLILMIFCTYFLGGQRFITEAAKLWRSHCLDKIPLRLYVQQFYTGNAFYTGNTYRTFS
jgi:hypothetical protein